jgi:hypothetical protein
LAYLAPEAQPSDMLRGRLLKTVRAEAKAGTAPVLASKKAMPFWLWGAVAAVVLFALYNFHEARALRELIRQTQVALDEQVELQKKSCARTGVGSPGSFDPYRSEVSEDCHAGGQDGPARTSRQLAPGPWHRDIRREIDAAGPESHAAAVARSEGRRSETNSVSDRSPR